jgi:3-deoxy-D-manno-octulosonate 8-phosphate phosphatase (KDO 8-P phosphatase)
MRLVSLPIAVGDAHFFAKQNAKWITDAKGGHGAVREITDGLISVHTDINAAYDKFLTEQVGKTPMDKL